MEHNTARDRERRFVDDMVGAVRELQPILIEHLDDHHETLAYVFMGDVARWAADEYLAQPRGQALLALLTYLERLW